MLNLVLLDLCSWCSGIINSKYMCCLSCGGWFVLKQIRMRNKDAGVVGLKVREKV